MKRTPDRSASDARPIQAWYVHLLKHFHNYVFQMIIMNSDWAELRLRIMDHHEATSANHYINVRQLDDMNNIVKLNEPHAMNPNYSVR